MTSHFYNFKIPSNANVKEKPLKLQPFHSFELERSHLLARFHKDYEIKFKELFYMNESPKDLMNFFLHEQLTNSERSRIIEDVSAATAAVYDHLLPKPDSIVDVSTHVMRIKNFYVLSRNPLAVTKEMSVNKFLQKIQPFLEVAAHYNENKQLSELLRRFRNKLDDERYEINRGTVDEFEAIFLKFSTYYEGQVEAKVAKFAEFLTEIIKNTSMKLAEISKKVFLEYKNFNENDYIIKNCIKYTNINQIAKLEYKGQSYQIPKIYLDKLKELYLIHNKVSDCNDLENVESRDSQFFLSRVFSLICRYESYFKNSIQLNEGYGFQAALPEHVFSELNRLFDVSEEMFASPFNCYFANYCSAFSDTDVFFGSCGSFFDYAPIEGSFECNPPFSTDIYDRMLSHVESLLSKSQRPLSFIVFIPERISGYDLNVDRLKKSKFLRETSIVLYNRHQFISGAQHLIEKPRGMKLYDPCHNTQIFFLQNKFGYEKWTPTQEKLDSLLKCMSYRVETSFKRFSNGNYNDFNSPNKKFKN